MTELYTIMRYLQYDTLMRMGMGHFDSWAATFGETVTAIELSPEGTGYRAKTRFARFFNLPELISIFKEAADIQTSDMLNLPVPEAEFINEVLKTKRGTAGNGRGIFGTCGKRKGRLSKSDRGQHAENHE